MLSKEFKNGYMGYHLERLTEEFKMSHD